MTILGTRHHTRPKRKLSAHYNSSSKLSFLGDANIMSSIPLKASGEVKNRYTRHSECFISGRTKGSKRGKYTSPWYMEYSGSYHVKAKPSMVSCVLGVLLVLLGVTSLITSSLALTLTTTTSDILKGNWTSHEKFNMANYDLEKEEGLEHYTLSDEEVEKPKHHRHHHGSGKKKQKGAGRGGGVAKGQSEHNVEEEKSGKIVFNPKLEKVTEDMFPNSDLDPDDEAWLWLNESEHRRQALTFNFTWPIRESASIVDGDIVLGALHMIHERSEEYMCGRVMDQGGIQAIEAMLYTLDFVNGDLDEKMLIPGVRLGVLAKDDCDTDIFGLEQALEFIKASISNIEGASQKCLDGSKPENKVKVISGVLGAPSSMTSIQVANLLKLFKIPQISFFSTSPILSSRERFPYFMRTIPSDVYQAEAIVALVKFLDWKYVSVVYEESSYGMDGFNQLDILLKENSICLALREKLLKDSGVAKESDYDKIVKNLLVKKLARGVIIFGSDQEVAGLMRAVRRLGATGQFAWIGSEGWGGRDLAYKGNEQEVEGAITVQPLAEEVRGFKDYFLSLRPDTNTRNPWFIEYWEDLFSCRYPDSQETPFNRFYTKNCTGQEQVSVHNFTLEAQLEFVSDAVMAFAYAFKDIHEKLCGGEHGMCERMTKIDGNLLRKLLLQVKFKGLSGQDFRFLKNGDGPPRYRILNFRRNDDGQYEWATVGYYQYGVLNVTSPLRFRSTEPQQPASVCSSECGRRQFKEYIDGDPCCWSCKNCLTYEYKVQETKCQECPMGTVPASNMTHCIPIPQIYLHYQDAVAFVAMAFASIGILATTAIAAIFLRHGNTPVVKASGRELSFVLLAGIFLCYTMTFLLVSKPSKYICGAQIVGIGFCFSVTYSAILTKTNRISRIFRAGKRTVKRPKFISPESQLVICASLVACQIIISLIWLLTSPPKAVSFYARRDDHQLVCEAAIGSAHMIGFTYPILLVLICTVYAIMTRKIPEAFNESKYIGFTMYTTCIIWAAFVVIYLSTSHSIQVRLVTMCFAISLSATVTLICMFTPKLYIIILRPERNVRQSMMAKNLHVKLNNSSGSSGMIMSTASIRVDSGTQSDDFELTRHFRSSGSFSSAYSRSTNATQTCSNGHSISTQTLDSVGDCVGDLGGEPRFEDDDVQL